MRVVQVLSSLSPGDGVGNDCLAIRKALIEEGLGTQIYAESISPKISKGIALPISHINEIKSDDIMIYHLAIGTELNFKIDQIQCKKVLRYHNITPGEFFYGYSRDTRNACSYGLKGVRFLADKMDYGLAVSEFNKKDLLKMGYKCPIEVMPILIPFSDYEKEADEHIIKKYSDGNTNIMFLGRISPNKRQEDIIRAFYLYKKYYDANARLFLVGSYAGMEKYYKRILYTF